MSQFKGTKGKWSIYGDGKYKLSIDSRIDDEYSFSWPTTIATINTTGNIEKVLSDGLLMSKSKEMLEELILSKEVIKTLEKELRNHHEASGGFSFIKSMDICKNSISSIERLIKEATTI